MITLRAERKLAAMLFADLSGYTRLCRQLDIEDVAAVVQPLMSSLQQAAVVQGGTVTMEAGDGFLAVFGVPTAQADVAGRALQAAEQMRKVRRSIAAASDGTPTPFVHIGIALGEVLVSPAPGPQGWSVAGEPINLASRLCDLAGADEVLVDERLAAVAGLDDRGAVLIEVKGYDRPLRAYALTPGAKLRSLTPPAHRFVGREEPLRVLDRALEEASALRVSKVLSVSGIAGIGKTRLVEHWLATKEGMSSATIRFDKDSTEPYLDVLRAITDLEPTGSSRLARLASEAIRDGLDVASGNADPGLFRATAREMLSGSAKATGPRVLLLDDLHRAPPGLVDFVKSLSDEPVQTPLLVIACWSADAGPDPIPGVRLAPLDGESVRALLTQALGGMASPRLASMLAESAEGHPLLLLQAIAHLKETVGIRVTDGVADLAGELPEALPATTRLFAAAMIDRLPDLVKRALLDLSTCGYRFPATVLPLLFGDESLDAVGELAQRGLLIPEERGWRFAHRPLREAAYAAQPWRTRAVLHQRQLSAAGENRALRAFHARQWLASLSPDAPDALTALVTTVCETRLHAAQLAVTDVRAALDALDLIVDLLPLAKLRIPDECSRALTMRAACLLESGEVEAALVDVESAAALTSGLESGPNVQVQLAEGRILSQLRRYDDSRRVLNAAILQAAEFGDATAQGSALKLLAETYRHSDSGRLVELTAEAYDVFVEAGDRAGAAECAQYLALWLSGAKWDEYHRWYRRAEALASQSDPRSRMWLSRARAYASAQRWDPAGRLRPSSAGRQAACSATGWRNWTGIRSGSRCSANRGA